MVYAKIKYILALLLVVFPICLSAKTLEGRGCAGDKQQALKFALEDIAMQIKVNIDSEVTRTIYQNNQSASEFSRSKIKTTTNLNIIGYSYEYDNKCVTATLSSESALEVYKSELNAVINAIDGYMKSADRSATDSEKTKLFGAALTAYNEYDRLTPVYRILDGTQARKPFVPRERIEADLMIITSTSADIKQIAANIKSQVNSSFYAEPVKLNTSAGLTPFGALLTDALNSSGKRTVTKHLSCNYAYDGTKEVFPLICKLTDQTGKTLQTVATNISANVCQQVECGKTNAMARLDSAYTNLTLKKTPIFYTNYGADTLYLKEGDILRLFTRPSNAVSMAVFHLDASAGKLSLMPLSKTGILSAGKEQAGKEIELAVFEIVPPFGSEGIILASCSKDFFIRLNVSKLNSEELLAKIKESADCGFSQITVVTSKASASPR